MITIRKLLSSGCNRPIVHLRAASPAGSFVRRRFAAAEPSPRHRGRGTASAPSGRRRLALDGPSPPCRSSCPTSSSDASTPGRPEPRDSRIFTDELEFAQISRSVAETGELHGAVYPTASRPSIRSWWRLPRLIDDTGSRVRGRQVDRRTRDDVTSSPPTRLPGRRLKPRPSARWRRSRSRARVRADARRGAVRLSVATICLYLGCRAGPTSPAQLDDRDDAPAAAAALLRASSRRDPVLGVALVADGSIRAPTAPQQWSRVYVGVGLLVIGATSPSVPRTGRVVDRVTGFPERMLEYGVARWRSCDPDRGPPLVPASAVLTRAAPRLPRPRHRPLTSRAALRCTFGSTRRSRRPISTSSATSVETEPDLHRALLFAGPRLVRRRPRVISLCGRRRCRRPLFLTRGAVPARQVPLLRRAGARDPCSPTATTHGRPARTSRSSSGCCLGGLLSRGAGQGRPRCSTAAATALVLGWTVTAQVSAADEWNSFARASHAKPPSPLDWVDRATGGKPAVYLGRRSTTRTGSS